MGAHIRKDRPSKAGKATAKTEAPRESITSRQGILSQTAALIMAAVKDHRNHLDTPGARIFGRLLTYTRQLLSYGAYVALAYLVFNILLAVQISFEKHKVLPLPGMVEARAALFNVLFFSLAAPIVIVALYITFRMLGNHIAAAAWRWLPRFAAPLFYPFDADSVGLQHKRASTADYSATDRRLRLRRIDVGVCQWPPGSGDIHSAGSGTAEPGYGGCR